MRTPIPATLLACAALMGMGQAHAVSITVNTGSSCHAAKPATRETNGTLLNRAIDNGFSTFHCPVVRVNPNLFNTTLWVQLNVIRQTSKLPWTCYLQSVDPQGTVYNSVSIVIEPWSGGAKTKSVQSASLSLSSQPDKPHSVSLRCDVPDTYNPTGSNPEAAGIISYIVVEPV